MHQSNKYYQRIKYLVLLQDISSEYIQSALQTLINPPVRAAPIDTFWSWASGERRQVRAAFMVCLLGFLRRLQFVPGSKDNDFKLVWAMDASTLSPHLVRPRASLCYHDEGESCDVVPLCTQIPTGSNLCIRLSRALTLVPGKTELGSGLRLAANQHSKAWGIWSLPSDVSFKALELRYFSGCQKSSPEPMWSCCTRDYKGLGRFFSFLFFFRKMCQRHNLFQWNREHTKQNWHLFTSNAFAPRRREIKRQLIWANKPIFYVFLLSSRL